MTSIVLTGTIVPQSNFVGVADVKIRRQEYLRCLNYYRGFGQVFFIENSVHDLLNDIDFQIDNVTLLKFDENDSSAFEFGKGYQEFKMMDSFVNSPDCPDSFYKITGRRYVSNFRELIQSQDPTQALFDIVQRHKIVDTSFFHCSRGFYKQFIAGAYASVNDAEGDWIERVLYSRFHRIAPTTLFPSTPQFIGFSGSTGAGLHSPIWKTVVRNAQRALYRPIGKREL